MPASQYVAGDLSRLFNPTAQPEVYTQPIKPVKQTPKQQQQTPAPAQPSKNAKKRKRHQKDGLESVVQATASQQQSDEDEKQNSDTELNTDPIEPVSKIPFSEAAQRRVSRKQQDATEQLLDQQLKRPKLTHESDPRLGRTLFIGNLSRATNRKQLEKTFAVFGAVESIRFRSFASADPKLSKKAAIVTRQLNDKKDTLNAYIVYKSDETDLMSVVKQMNGQTIDGHVIRVDRAAQQGNDNSRSVFIGNLPFDAKEDELRVLFLSCGTIESVRIIRDPASGIGKGFGYILFADAAAVKKATLFHETIELRERKLRVVKAQNEDKMKLIQQAKKQMLSVDSKRKSGKIDAAAAQSERQSAERSLVKATKFVPRKKEKHAKRKAQQAAEAALNKNSTQQTGQKTNAPTQTAPTPQTTNTPQTKPYFNSFAGVKAKPSDYKRELALKKRKQQHSNTSKKTLVRSKPRHKTVSEKKSS